MPPLASCGKNRSVFCSQRRAAGRPEGATAAQRPWIASPGSGPRGSLAMTALFAAGLGVTGDRNDQARRTSGGHGAQRERRHLAAGPVAGRAPSQGAPCSAPRGQLHLGRYGLRGAQGGQARLHVSRGDDPRRRAGVSGDRGGRRRGLRQVRRRGREAASGELLKAVVHYATGGMAALKKRRNAGSALLIEQLWDASTPGPMAPNDNVTQLRLKYMSMCRCCQQHYPAGSIPHLFWHQNR